MHNSKVHHYGSVIKNLPVKQETWVWSLGRKDLLEKDRTTHSSILAWEIPWTWQAAVHGVKESQTQLSDQTTAAKYTIRWVLSFRPFLVRIQSVAITPESFFMPLPSQSSSQPLRDNHCSVFVHHRWSLSFGAFYINEIIK